MGKRTKIAPYLQAVLEENREGSFAWAMAVRELRALIAVAKAAQHLSIGIYEDTEGRCRLSADAIPLLDKLRTDLARLARASGEGGK